jgi:hypothetical protein
MKELGEEARRFKELYVETQIKVDIVAEALVKSVRPSRRREIVDPAVEHKAIAIRLAGEAIMRSESAEVLLSFTTACVVGFDAVVGLRQN